MSVEQQLITAADWDAFVGANVHAHVLQQWAWGELKAAYGWKVERLFVRDDRGQILALAQVLFRTLPLHLGTMAYLAMGPLVVDPYPEKVQPRDYALAVLWERIRQSGLNHRAAFLKWEPGIFTNGLSQEAVIETLIHGKFQYLGLRQSPQTVQPPRTVMIDISSDEDTILARMNQGTRRKIRQSLKNGITYREGTKADVNIFTGMMNTTGERNDFGVHEPAYYQKAFDLFVPQGDAALILAEHEGDPLAGIMVFAKGKTAWYLYGASSNIKRNLMGAYGVQWAAIQWAKAKGCTEYDMWGIPDEDETILEAQFESRSDGLWGVYGFKRGWGGEVVRSLGAWDKVYNPVIYAAYQLALRARG
ncbi:MAG: peptidoglycan bridge formation glycyltransferase FemA/FemB family protein [Anaerolineaceae bacterium]|nr:peptidoglycan bridge formation glycyltransferase FemA/FemB family protein [Anaerolineaceae bacterium]